MTNEQENVQDRNDRAAENACGNGNRQTRRHTGRCFWALVAVGVAILGLRCLTGGSATHREESPIRASEVTPQEPSAESVKELQRKREEELRRQQEEVRRQQEERQRREEERQMKLETEKLKADVAARTAKYQGDVRAIAEKYRKMLPLWEAEQCFSRAEQGADFIASGDGLCGFKACAKLAYKMAYDKIKGTHTVEDAINPIVDQRVAEPVEEAVKVYEKWTTDLRQELQREEMAYASDLALRSQQFSAAVSCFKLVDASKMNTAVDTLVGAVKEHAKGSAFAAAGAAVELALIRSSYQAIKAVAMRIAGIALSGVAKKLAGTASSAAISAAADGPLPFGDAAAAVITVVGLGWTAWDIRKVCKTMPAEMQSGIRSAIDEVRGKLQQTALENLKADCDKCLSSADARMQELNGMLER